MQLSPIDNALVLRVRFPWQITANYETHKLYRTFLGLCSGARLENDNLPAYETRRQQLRAIILQRAGTPIKHDDIMIKHLDVPPLEKCNKDRCKIAGMQVFLYL